MISNRQGGRRRGRGGGGRVPGSPNLGNRQDNRQRGNAAQLLEKYKGLARDAQTSGDRVQAEYFLQFADHYFRVLNENRPKFEDQRRGRDDDQSDEDEREDTAEDREESGREERKPRRERAERPDRTERAERPERAERSAGNGDDQPRRRSRRQAEPEDGGDEEKIALDSLPPSISGGSEGEGEAQKPRRRTRRPRDGEEIAPAA